VLSGEATNTKLIVFGLTRSRLEPTIYGALEFNEVRMSVRIRVKLGSTREENRERIGMKLTEEKI
jgi:hypothetical protein